MSAEGTAGAGREERSSRPVGTAGFIVRLVVVGLLDALLIWALASTISVQWWLAVGFFAFALIAINVTYLTGRFLPLKFLLPGVLFLIVFQLYTMAFTASALSFMLEDLAKPVILTGSQIPLEETRNDAQHNLLTAILILGRHHRELSEVMIYFDSVLLRGNRTTKVSVDSFDAFESPNFPPLGRVGIEIAIDARLTLPARAPHRWENRGKETVEVLMISSRLPD